MISAAPPTIVALHNHSAWVVVVGVSIVTFALILLFRRLIARPGGLMSAVLLTLPLVLPLVAAAAFQSAVFPEFAVLRPADPSVAGDPHVFFLHAPESQLLIPYRLVGVSGMWLLFVAAGASLLMLLRRVASVVAARRLMARCVPVTAAREDRVSRLLQEVAVRLDLDRSPQVLLLPGDQAGVFCSRRGGGRIFISRQLLDCLSDAELRGMLAHEIAHLRAHDTTVTFVAGLLRDVVVWNPVAHLAHRRLLADRELEADRIAASVTGPLPIASGLVKVCEALGSRKSLAQRGVIAFLRPNGAVKRRVRALLEMADGAMALEPSSRTTYLLAALLVAGVGLQAGAQIAREQPDFSAVFLGAPSVSSVEAWPTRDELAALAESNRKKPIPPNKLKRRAQRMVREARIASITGAALDRPYGFREDQLGGWLRTVTSLAELRGEVPTVVNMPPKAWRADLPRSGFGPIRVVRIHEESLEHKVKRSRQRAPAAKQEGSGRRVPE